MGRLTQKVVPVLSRWFGVGLTVYSKLMISYGRVNIVKGHRYKLGHAWLQGALAKWSEMTLCWHLLCLQAIVCWFILSLSSNLPTCTCAEVEDLGSKELVLAEKTVTIEIKANEQGKFVKILEVISTDHWSIYHQYTVLPPTPCPWEMGAGDGWKDSLWW